MAQALQFTGNGYAQVPGYVFSPNPGAVEFYVRTTVKNQTLFSSGVQTSFLGNPITGEGLVLWLDSTGAINLQVTSQLFVNNQTTVQGYKSTAVATDGGWHLVSLYYDTNNFNLFLDGAPAKLTATTKASAPVEAELPPRGNWTSTGDVYFGADRFNAKPLAPAFTGYLSELRVWQGGNPSFVLVPAFSLNVGVPLSAGTANLQLYWPFWVNQSNDLVDQVSKVQLELAGPTIAADAGQYYNDLSEVICNGTMTAFDPFTTGGTGAAFRYLMQQIGLPAYTPTTFRALYGQPSYANLFSIYYTNIKDTPYQPSPEFTEVEFSYVQARLLAELEGVSTVWGFYNTATQNLVFIGNQIQAAANTVYSTAFSAEVSITTPATSNVGSIVDAIATVVGFIPDGGKVVAGIIKGAWATVSFFSNPDDNDYPNFQSAMMVEAQASNLQTAVDALIAGLNNGVQRSLAIILSDWGLLNTINQRLANGDSFAFGPSLNPNQNPDLKGLVSLYNASILLLSQTLLCGGYPLYGFYLNQYGNYVVVANWDIQAPIFNLTFGTGQSPLGGGYCFGGQGIIGYRTANGHNGYATYSTLSAPIAAMLNNAATALTGQAFTQAEVYSWPFQKQFPSS